MASPAHVIVDGSDDALLADRAVLRVAALERLWSRFIPSSEISALNRSGGRWLALTWETFDLVERAVHGWRATAGLFDPTITSLLIALGHDEVFGGSGEPWRLGAGEIELDRARSRVRLPAGVAFDPGGIGKGLAADIVVAELLDEGASRVCVNLGGDLALGGVPPEGGWTVGIADPSDRDVDLERLRVHSGGVATSSRLARTWTQGDQARHHLVQPLAGVPAGHHSPRSVTVLADEAWWAEALGTAVAVASDETGHELLRAAGATAVIVDHAGRVHHLRPTRERR
jgi:thiamine biosynthesis lipoprotein